MEIEKPSRRRRNHTEEFKQAVIAACCEAGASVAGIALANGVNANQVRRWMRERDIEPPSRSLPARSISPARGTEPAFMPVPNGSATARAIDYSLKRWVALTHYLSDGQVPIDNNWIVNQIRPIALGRKNWLFAGSLRAGKRAAAIMSLIQSAKLNGHEPLAYLKDVLTRLPTQTAIRIDKLLPHRWKPQILT